MIALPHFQVSDKGTDWGVWGFLFGTSSENGKRAFGTAVVTELLSFYWQARAPYSNQ